MTEQAQATAAETTQTAPHPRAANVRRAEVQPLINAYNDAARELPSSNASRAADNAMVLVVRYLERAMDDAAEPRLTPTGRRARTAAARTRAGVAR